MASGLYSQHVNNKKMLYLRNTIIILMLVPQLDMYWCILCIHYSKLFYKSIVFILSYTSLKRELMLVTCLLYTSAEDSLPQADRFR